MDRFLNQIICGDCLEVMRELPDKSVDLVLTDPPYNIGKAKWDKIPNYIEWVGAIFLECQRVLKDNGSFYFFHNDLPQIAQLMEWLRQNTRFIFKSFITVDKMDNSFAKDLYGKQEQFRNYINLAEYCLFYTFQDETGLEGILPLCYEPYLDYMTQEKNNAGLSVVDCNKITGHKSIASHWFWQEPVKRQPQPRFIQKQDYLKLEIATGYFQKPYESLRQEYESQRYIFNEKNGKKNVWKYFFREDKQIKHPTQKPIRLISDIIKASSNEGDIIIDPFLGSGTTAIAAHNTGRFFIGIEKEPKYVEIARKRLEQAQSQQSLFG